MKNFRLLVGLGLLLTTSVFAQTRSLTGSVADPSGQLISGATVKLIYELNGEERTGVTNTAGDFAFSALVPGAYTVRVESRGFRPAERKGNLVLAAGRLVIGTLPPIL
jgi:Carboxypeptidase regulatory-like domain